METAAATKAAETAIAVPGALGIILAIATFAFMAWLVYFVMMNNAKREDKLMEIIQRDLAQQQAALGRMEQAGAFQRAEHEKMMKQGDKCLERHDASVHILERIVGMLSAGQGKTING